MNRRDNASTFPGGPAILRDYEKRLLSHDGSNLDARTKVPDDDEKRLSHEGSNLGARTKRPDDDDSNHDGRTKRPTPQKETRVTRSAPSEPHSK